MKQKILIMLMLSLTFAACKKDDDKDCPDGTTQKGDQCVDPAEVITTVGLTFSDITTQTTYYFRDLDGPGGADPTIDTILLNSTATYAVTVTILDESKTPVADIGQEVHAEGENHQLFYTMGSGLDLTWTYDDQDTNGDPIGLSMTCVSGAASSGDLRVLLKHQPGTKNGLPSTGSTDVDAAFPTVIQ